MENDSLTNEMADCLEALGNPTRLRIFRVLVQAGEDGASVGAIQRRVGIPASTLTHHIQRLVKAGLARQSRESRQLICQADYGLMASLIDYLNAECCRGLADDLDKDTAA